MTGISQCFNIVHGELSPKIARLVRAFPFLNPGLLNRLNRLPDGEIDWGSPDKHMTDKKEFVPTHAALHRKPQRDASAALKKQILEVADEVFDRYVWGESLLSISTSLPFPVQGWKLRSVLMESEETAERFAIIGQLRAHNLVDQALDYGRQAASIGDSAGLKVGIDVNLKVASKLAPAEYGEKTKMELTGKDGGALQVKADLTLTAEQAYERLIKGQ